jgi:hypothetical protein
MVVPLAMVLTASRLPIAACTAELPWGSTVAAVMSSCFMEISVVSSEV